MQIKTKDLLYIIDILKREISNHFGDVVEIETEDFYWEILSSDELYDPTSCPKELGLGQLSDDWSELLRLRDVNEIPISYDLKRLAVILKLIWNKSLGKW